MGEFEGMAEMLTIEADGKDGRRCLCESRKHGMFGIGLVLFQSSEDPRFGCEDGWVDGRAGGVVRYQGGFAQ